jgi:hypothetical protein
MRKADGTKDDELAGRRSIVQLQASFTGSLGPTESRETGIDRRI